MTWKNKKNFGVRSDDLGGIHSSEVNRLAITNYETGDETMEDNRPSDIPDDVRKEILLTEGITYRVVRAGEGDWRIENMTRDRETFYRSSDLQRVQYICAKMNWEVWCYRCGMGEKPMHHKLPAMRPGSDPHTDMPTETPEK